MAYGKRLIIVGSDIAGNNIDVNVYLEGYTGDPVTRSGAGDVLQINWGAKAGEQLPLIYGSEAIVRFFAESDFEFLTLFATNARDIKVEVIMNETDTIWVGYMEPEKWSEPLISPNYEVTFSAFDGLGMLKDEDFLDDNKAYYTGEMTLQAILYLVLSRTGLYLPINTRVNYRPSGQSTAENALLQVKKNVVTYQGLTCYEVLEKLFMNCRIFQRGGEWYVISNDAWYADTVTCFAYTAGGVANGTKVIDTTFTGYWFEDQATLEMMPALKQVRVFQDYGYKKNIIDNGDFGTYDGYNFDGWTATGTIATQHTYNKDGDKYVYLMGNENLNGPSGSWADANRTDFLVSDPIPIKKASDLFNFGLNYALRGPVDQSAYMFWSLWLDGDDGKDYTIEIYRTPAPNREIKYRWKESTYKLPIPVASHIDKDNHYRITPDRIPAYSYNDVVNHFKSAKFSIEDGIPTTGTIQIYLFVPHSGGTVHGSCFHSVDLFLTDEAEEDFPTSTEYILVNNLRNNYTPEDISLPHGDIPDSPNKLTVYDGGFLLASDSSATTAWKHDSNATTYTYAELMARLLAGEMYIAKHSYQARLADTLPTTALRFTDPDNSNRKFIEAGITYDFRMNTIDGKFVEVLPLSITPYTIVEIVEIDEGTSGSSGGSSGGSTTPAPAIDSDERVKLIDPDTSEVLGQAGYLSALSFKATMNETTGRAVIEPITDGIENGFGKPQPTVTWISGLTFYISYGVYYIGGKKYYCPGTTITLSAADATHPRIDVFAVTDEYTVVAIEGTPAASPAKPQVDPSTQLELTQVYIPALATEPATPGGDPYANELIYDENTEWTPAASGTTADFASTTDPVSGTKCAEITDISKFDTIKFTSSLALLMADYATLNLSIKLKEEMPSDYALFATLMLAGNTVSNDIRLEINRSYTAWQKVAVSMADFVKTGTQFDVVRFKFGAKSILSVYSGFYLDNIYLQYGPDQPPVAVEDTYVTGLSFNNTTRILTIEQNNGKDDIEIEIPGPNTNYLRDWIEFEFRDIEAGTAAEYILDLKALVAYTINAAVMQVDNGTLDVSFTINGTTVTGPSVSASTTITETAATAANTVAAGNIVKLVVSTTYTGTPTLIRGKLNLTRT